MISDQRKLKQDMDDQNGLGKKIPAMSAENDVEMLKNFIQEGKDLNEIFDDNEE